MTQHLYRKVQHLATELVALIRHVALSVQGICGDDRSGQTSACNIDHHCEFRNSESQFEMCRFTVLDICGGNFGEIS